MYRGATSNRNINFQAHQNEAEDMFGWNGRKILNAWMYICYVFIKH